MSGVALEVETKLGRFDRGGWRGRSAGVAANEQRRTLGCWINTIFIPSEEFKSGGASLAQPHNSCQNGGVKFVALLF